MLRHSHDKYSEAFYHFSGFNPTTVMSVVSGIFDTRENKIQEHIVLDLSVFLEAHISAWSAVFRRV